ncbi:MAG: Lrp/AsnC family transcriptional regulator [Candidatus Bilamarchaeum sp.]|jgi:DNA-binding Lrp family transcriptional regulator
MKDTTDDRILDLLQKNARMSNVEIAKSVGLTEGAIRRRVSNLEKSGVISKYTIEISSVGRIFAVVMVKSKDETKRMMAAISELGICYDSYEISGEFDGCLILDGSSIEDIDNKIDKLRKISNVADTKTFVSFRRW